MCFSKTSTNNTAQNQQGASSGSQSGVSMSSALDPNVQAAYSALLPRAESLSNQPLQLYQGPMVAGLTPTQNQAISQISNASTAASPFINQAAGYATQSATPISLQQFNPSTISQYMSPYTQNVVDTTKALMDEQNKEQQLQLQGSATAAGAWNGDRSAVAQSILARQQDLANNATLANIYQQGYQGAVGQFNTAQQQSLQQQQANNQNAAQTAYSLGSLGTALQNAGLSGGAAMLNAGTLQQQVNQAQLNVPYQQYLQQQAYPYQSLSFLSSLLPTIAQGTGIGTTSSNQYAGNNYSYGTGTGKSTVPFSILASGGRARLSDGGMDNTADEGFPGSGGAIPPGALSLLEAQNLGRAGENPVTAYSMPAVPQISSYVPSVTNGGSSLSFPGGSTMAPPSGTGQMAPMNLSGAPMAQPQGTGLVQGAVGSAGNGFLNGLTSGQQSGSGLSGWASGLGAGASDWLGSLFGSGAASVAAPNIAADLAGSGALTSGLSDAASSIMGLSLLKKGGRARLADGGNDDDEDLSPDEASLAQPTPKTDRVMTLQEAGQAFPDYSFAGQASAPPFSPTWDDGTPVAPPDQASLHQAADNIATRMTGGQPIPTITQAAYHPSMTNAILKGLGTFLGHHSIGQGIAAGVDEWEKDNHPEVDHSGETTVVRYADGTTVDTGIPTEAALNQRAMADYRRSSLASLDASRRQAALDRADRLREQAQRDREMDEWRRQSEADRHAYQAGLLDLRGQTAGQGRFSAPVPGLGMDDSGKQVPGVYTTNLKTGDPVFHPGVTLTAKPAPAKAPVAMTPAAAMSAAQRDYDRIYPAPKPNPYNPGFDMSGNQLQPRPVPKEGMASWLKKRQGFYLQSPQGASVAQPAPQAAVSGPLTVPPPRPNNVPPGARWSPSKQQWWWQQGGAWQHS